MNQFINAILQLKKNNLLAEIPLEPAEVEKFKQHVYEDLNRRFEEIKEVNIPYVMFYQIYMGKKLLLKY